jgi:hypothetical protein
MNPGSEPQGFAELALILAILAFFGFVWARIFSRAGYSRWWILALLVPFFNLFVIGKLILRAGYSLWWTLTMFIPLVNFIMLLMFAYSEWPGQPEQPRALPSGHDSN